MLWLAVWYLAWAVVQSFQWEASPGCSWPSPRHSGLTWALSSSWSPLSCYRFLLQGNERTERSVSSSPVTSQSTQCGLVPEEEDCCQQFGLPSSPAATLLYAAPLILCSVCEEMREETTAPGVNTCASGHFLSRWAGLRIYWKCFN